jgi:hypothetical protein
MATGTHSGHRRQAAVFQRLPEVGAVLLDHAAPQISVRDCSRATVRQGRVAAHSARAVLLGVAARATECLPAATTLSMR